MKQPTSLVFACLAIFLVAFPLTLVKPGWPAGLKSDEPAYYLMSLSLAHDGDLHCGVNDLERLFEEFPYHVVYNLILATDDGWHTVFFGKPYIYSLAAAPAAWLFGASGMVAFNMAMMLLMVWLGARFLSRYNPDWLAMLFSFGFFFLSCGYAYIFWLHPEIFNMTAVTVSLYFALAKPWPREGKVAAWRRLLDHPSVRSLLSGLALMPAVYNKPMLLALCLPALYAGWQAQRLRGVAVWSIGAVLGMGFVIGLSMWLTGHPTAYLLARGGQEICTVDKLPVEPLPPPPPAVETVAEGSTDGHGTDSEAAAAPQRPRASWFWLLRIPRPHPMEVVENISYFLWGRHTGLLLYFPFAALGVLFFLLHNRRSLDGWILFLALGTIALYFLLWIPFNWQGGGGFVGNRYFVNAYPGFLFLARRLSPKALQVVGFTLAGLLLGPTIFSPWGRAVPSPTLQAHVRNAPFSHFPLELSLREIPGYEQRIYAGTLVRGRSDVFLPRGGRFWVHGATTTELWIQSETPQESLLFEVASLAAPNDITLRVGNAEHRITYARDAEPQGAEGVVAPGAARVELKPSKPTRVRRLKGRQVYVYKVEITAERGAPRTWDRRFPPQDCEVFAYNETIQESFFVGARVAFLGSRERAERDLYAVDWADVVAPERVAAGETFHITPRVRNASGETWPADPPTRVGISYRWLDTSGAVKVAEGIRTHPESPVAPDAIFETLQEVQAPDQPGQYTLELDLVYEFVAWFSSKNDGDVYRIPIEVTPAPDDPTDLESTSED